MKWLNHLLAFYILLLAVVPCCAFDNCGETNTTLENPIPASGHSKKDCDCCSPFFNCESCASVTIDIQSAFPGIVSMSLKKSYTGFIPSFVSPIYYDFWQPPRWS